MAKWEIYLPRFVKILLLIFLALGVSLGLIGLGIFIGLSKAYHSYQWGENYHRYFAGPKVGFLKPLPPGKDFLNPHAVFGKIIELNDNSIIISDETTKKERIVLVGSGTLIIRGNDKLKLSDLKVDDQVVVIGRPNKDAQIEAKLVRVFRD